MTPQETFINALGWTLVHFVWQGALIAGVLAVALVCLRRAGSRVRYAISCAALVGMAACAGLTFANFAMSGGTAEIDSLRVSIPADAPTAIAAQPTEDQAGAEVSTGSTLARYIPLLVWTWFVGVFVLSMRSLGGWMVAQRFARVHTCPAERMWQARFSALKQRLAISQPVKLAVSTCAQVPAVVGWIKPVVLVPAAAFAGLTAEQMEALLAHELAHVRRQDYLVNLLQTAAETLLFYHPGVWWVSRQIRNERENCCDDLAVEVCGSALTYVRALTELEQMRGGTPKLAMAADGGSLMARARRLLSSDPNSERSAPVWLMGLTAVAAITLAAFATNGLAQRTDGKSNDRITAEEKRENLGWLAELEAAGYRNLDIDELIRLKEHGVDGSYARSLQAQGLKLTTDELVRFREHGVEPDFIADLQKTGLKDLDPDEIIRLSEHGVDPQFIDELKSVIQGMQMNADEVIRLSEHGVRTDWIRKIQDAGYKDADADTLIRLSEHGVTAETISELQKTGLADLDADEVIRLTEHGVGPDWIREMQGAGFRDESVDAMIRLNEHGVTVEQMNGLKQVGLASLSADEMIRLTEHGVRPNWIREIQSTGYAKASVDELIRMTEHGITAGQINDAAKQGFKNLSIDQLIRLSEHGMLNR